MAKIKIDEEACIGCGLCASLCPEAFEIINGKAKVKGTSPRCKDIVKECPVGAIKIS